MDGLRCLVGGLLVCSILSTGCDVEVNKPAASVTLVGRVFSADQGKPVAGVEVTGPDGSVVKSGADGSFTLKSEGEKAGAVRTKSEAHAPVSKEAPKSDGYIELFVKDVDGKQDVVNKSGGSVKGKEGAAVKVAKDSLFDAEGKPAGKARVDIANPDPRRPTDLPSIPGDFDAKKGGKTGKISAESPMHVRAAEGEKSLGLGKGKNMEADLPVRRADAAREGALFRFDDDEQSWVFVRMVERVSNKTGVALPNAQVEPELPVYRAEIDELGWWAVGEFFDELTCVRACVVDAEGQPVPFARAVATGVDHFTQLTTYADDKGCFALDVRAKAQISLAVQAIDGFVEPLLVETKAEELSAADDPGKCQDLGQLKLKAAEASSCPFGLRECGDACVDVRADALNCGACDKSCGGAEGRELSCVDGACECPLGQRLCTGAQSGGDGSQPSDPGGGTGSTMGPSTDTGGKVGEKCATDEECAAGTRCLEGVCSTAKPSSGGTGTQDAGAPAGGALPAAQGAGYCATLRTDDQNCGACGVVCGAGSMCIDGACSDKDPGPDPEPRDSGVPITEPDAGSVSACGECLADDLGVAGVAEGCCTPLDRCGSVVTTVLVEAGFMENACIERGQKGAPARACPALSRDTVDLGVMTLPGCCRAEGVCGYDTEQVTFSMGGQTPHMLGFGCISYGEANSVQKLQFCGGGGPVTDGGVPADSGTVLPPPDSGITPPPGCVNDSQCNPGETCNLGTGVCEITAPGLDGGLVAQ